ncbi:MAG: hypothetical protein ACI90Q_001696, partial [Nonlabens sp.]
LITNPRLFSGFRCILEPIKYILKKPDNKYIIP